MTCPDLLVLSQLVDRELAPANLAALGAHVDGCGVCRERIGRLERALAALQVAIASPTWDPGKVGGPGSCLGPEQVAGWVQRVLSPADFQAVEAHLAHCDACLEEALGAARLVARLDADERLPVPVALTERVASRWGAVPAEESLTRLVIRLARAGATLIERHIVAPILDVELSMVPATATRGEEADELVSFRLRAAEAQIRGTIVPEGSAIRLVLRVLGRTDEALMGQRVFLRHHGRSIYSARTDATGRLETPRIERSVYEVSCPAIGTSFRLDLRS
jgi:anti-sigma factor RsiW